MTIADIEKLIIDQLEAQFNFSIPLLTKAFNRTLARVLAAVWMINYKYGNWMILQLFVSTASFKPITIFGKTIRPLIEWGRLIGVGDPLPATAAKLDIDITVNTVGATLDAGTQFISNINGLIYITDQSYLLVGAVDTIEVVCVQPGTQGNLTAANPISLVNPLGIIDRDAVVNAVTLSGVDAETEDDYRARVEEKFKERPQGGAYVDYRIWASEVTGVDQTYWYTADIPTHVIGYVAGDIDIYPNRIPNSALLLAVGDAVDFETVDGVKVSTRRPIGAIIDPAGDKTYTNIKPVVIKDFDINIIDLSVDDLAGVKALISTALTSYFLEREAYIEGLSFPPVVNNIQQSQIIGLIQNIVTANNGTFLTAVVELVGVTVPNYVLQEGELAELNLLLYDGA